MRSDGIEVAQEYHAHLGHSLRFTVASVVSNAVATSQSTHLLHVTQNLFSHKLSLAVGIRDTRASWRGLGERRKAISIYRRGRAEDEVRNASCCDDFEQRNEAGDVVLVVQERLRNTLANSLELRNMHMPFDSVFPPPLLSAVTYCCEVDDGSEGMPRDDFPESDSIEHVDLRKFDELGARQERLDPAFFPQVVGGEDEPNEPATDLSIDTALALLRLSSTVMANPLFASSAQRVAVGKKTIARQIHCIAYRQRCASRCNQLLLSPVSIRAPPRPWSQRSSGCQGGCVRRGVPRSPRLQTWFYLEAPSK